MMMCYVIYLEKIVIYPANFSVFTYKSLHYLNKMIIIMVWTHMF